VQQGPKRRIDGAKVWERVQARTQCVVEVKAAPRGWEQMRLSSTASSVASTVPLFVTQLRANFCEHRGNSTMGIGAITGAFRTEERISAGQSSLMHIYRVQTYRHLRQIIV
jgi:hypothetical protein